MFKSIRYKLIIYTALLIFSTAAFTVSIIGKHYAPSVIFVFICLRCLKMLNKHYEKFNDNILFLLESLDNGDYSFSFSETKLSLREKELNMMLNRVKQILVNARENVIEKEKYLSIILEGISAGIVVFTDNKHVQNANKAAIELLGLRILTHLDQLSVTGPDMPRIFSELKPGNSTQITVTNERESNLIMVNVSEIKTKIGVTKIAVLNNIGNELDAKETESWIKLIRVMTHEIMNSIAPVTSLSETLSQIYSEEKERNPDNDLVNDTYEAFDTINTTSKGLTSFVQSYRKFTGVAKPSFKPVDIKILLEKVLLLESINMREKGISYELVVETDNTVVLVDEGQIIQVIINLLRNAVHAIDKDDGKIVVTLSKTGGRPAVSVADNGDPIPPDVFPNIFVPFFTTKKSGSGIGLSLSRYIMRLHGGNLKHHVNRDKYTVFTMEF